MGTLGLEGGEVGDLLVQKHNSKLANVLHGNNLVMICWHVKTVRVYITGQLGQYKDDLQLITCAINLTSL